VISIINYGIGNLESIANMFKKYGIKSHITNDPDTIEQADKIILPGVGHFGHCMQKLNESGLLPMLEQKALKDRIPVLGICVGHQMLFEKSEEGNAIGLNWIPGQVIKFNSTQLSSNYKIPHMGWSDIGVNKPDSNLFDGIIEPRFYFTHSYHVECYEQYVLAKASYGYDFVAAVQKGNIFGVQFHPEKSHRFGMELLKNFAAI